MIREIIWLALFLTNFLCYEILGIYIALIFFILLILEILREYGVFQEITFVNKTLDESTLFYYDYVGDYSKVNILYQKVHEIVKEKNLDSNLYKSVGLYYYDQKI